MTSEPPRSLDLLLAQSDWVTALARALVRDASAADDAVQATWLDVLRDPPQVLRNPRAFLATLLRRKVQRRQRTDRRRQRHETGAAPDPAASVPSAALLTERLETHRALVDAVLALDEPYRETLVLRYFENLEVDAIAARHRCPANTVRSRLQRALQTLRGRLDGRPGGRETWLGGLAALAERRLAGEAAGSAAVGAVAVGLAWTLAMKKLLVVAVLALVGGFGLWWSLSPGMPAPDARVAVAVPAPAAVGAGSPPSALAVAPPVPREAAAAGAAVAPPSPPRWLADRGGRPLAGVAMRAASANAVRWQGGDRGWIRGPEGTRRIEAADEERLRSDPGFAATWFAQFAHPEEWRAEILGTPLPGREFRTGTDGGFVFPDGVADADIDVGDSQHVLVAPGQTGLAPWRAGAATRVTGTVRDVDGRPVVDAFVIATVPEADGRELPGAIEVRTDDAGRFLVRRALGDGLLRVRCDGFATAWVATAAPSEQALDIVLTRRVDRDQLEVAGTVVDGGGRAIADAKVWFGRQRTVTDRDGRFRFAADGVTPLHALTVVAPGRAAWQRDGFGASVIADPAAARDLLIVLVREAATLAGTVLGSDGRPLAGALVGLADGTVLDVTFTPVEGLVGGFEQAVRTDAAGNFLLPGLGERAYRVTAVDPATAARCTSASHRASDGPLLLRLPTDLRRQVRGRVVRGGEAVPNARIEVGYCLHVTKGGGTMFDAAPAVTSGADGRFVLPALPRRDAWLQVREGDVLRQVVPVAALPDDDVVVELDGRRWLQLVDAAAAAGATMHFERRDGSVVAAVAIDGREARIGADGEAPVVCVPEPAVAVLVASGTRAVRRLPLTDDHAVHLRVGDAR